MSSNLLKQSVALSLEQEMLKHAANFADPDYTAGTDGDEKVLWRPIVPPDRENGQISKQQMALESEADQLLYGGAAGGGKSDLLLGAAITEHQRSIIFRREFKQLRALIDRSREVVGESGRFNENLHVWRDLPGGRTLEFGGVKHEEDKKNYRGRPHDLKAFDEITEFTESQFRFLIAWCRTAIPGQRTRILCSCNPPTDEDGSWIIEYWAPWLDKNHPNPAQEGELRWFVVLDGKDIEVDSGEPFLHNGETLHPHSRTFVSAKLADNPYLYGPEYLSQLMALPEPLRSQLLEGKFGTSGEVDPYQVLPTAWVRAAQKRWLEMEKPTTPLTGVGVDCARGGKDLTCFALRYDNWFAEVIAHPGEATPDGGTAAYLLMDALSDEPPEKRKQTWYINVDVIGIGSSAYDHLRPMYRYVTPIFANGSSQFRDKSKKMGMQNIRAEYYWRFREALDPRSGVDIALPPGNDVLADLCAARYKLTARGILIEDKRAIRKRLGRSPNKGDAILLAHMVSSKSKFWARGPSS